MAFALLNARGGVLSRGGCQLCLASYTQVYLLTYVKLLSSTLPHDSYEYLMAGNFLFMFRY